jgi:hypothetical protein
LIRVNPLVGLCLAAGLLPAAACAQAPVVPPARCPWLNVATASGVLNGPATLAMHQPAADETVCEFRYGNQKTMYSLQIEVWAHQDITKGLTVQESACTAPGTALRAIGNEAILCTEDTKSVHGDAIVSRVRDSIFRVSLTTTVRNDPALPRDVLEQKTRDSAEAVAGSLF